MNQTLANRALCHQMLRVSPDTFSELVEKLQERIVPSFLCLKEIVAIGLFFLSQNPTIRDQCMIFGLSNKTIQKCRKLFVEAVLKEFSFYFEPIYWNATGILDAETEREKFNGAIGAIDGTHIPIRVFSEDSIRYRNRKGFISTNILIFCDFNMNILYVCSGVEGSAHDAHVLEISGLYNELTKLPPHVFVLADAGYGITERILTPYRSTRYHLQEYSSTNGPSNSKELFNLRHSKMRNVVERTIGILKRRWKILRFANESLNKNFINESIICCCMLHNFLMQKNDMQIDENALSFETSVSIVEEAEEISNLNNNSAAKIWRNSLANEMWSNYV